MEVSILNGKSNASSSDTSRQHFAKDVMVIILLSGVLAAVIMFCRIFGNAHGYMQRIDDDGSTVKYYHVGGKPYTGFRCIDGELYAFNENGEPFSGLTEIDGKTYCFDLESEHALKKSFTFEENGKKYYADCYGSVSEEIRTGLYRAPDGYNYYYESDGKKASARWVEINGNRYYLQPVTGRMLVSETAMIDGVRYSFDDNGLPTIVS